MSILSKVFGRMMGLSKVANDTLVERDLRVTLRDGVVILADRWVPVGVKSPPLILVRSPYGRAGLFGVLAGELFAERGFQVVVVSARGTFGSGGHFGAFQQEGADGVDTVAWLRQQAFYPGSFGTHGPSYLGLTQWAIGAQAGPELKAMALQVTASEFRNQTYPNESFALENGLAWADLIATQERSVPRVLLHNLYRPKLARALMHLPLNEADRVATGKTMDFYQGWLEHDAPDDPWWAPAMHDESVAHVTAAVHMQTGWYDLFLPWQMRDYAKLVAAGNTPRLVIGPWAHSDPKSISAGVREGLAFLGETLRGDAPSTSAPVRIFVGGQDAWRELPSWPPASTSTAYYLHAAKKLGTDAPGDGAPDTYRYDPADPTPSVGGPLLQSDTSGPRDQRKLEARADVLTYSTDVLARDLDVIGTPEADLFVQSSLAHADFFVRVCDVHPNGKSINVCDALFRIKPGTVTPGTDGVLHLRFELWPTAHRFLAGHRVRVQVSSGAHPRIARNLGSGEPLATGTRLVVADQKVFHDDTHRSAVLLPIVAS